MRYLSFNVLFDFLRSNGITPLSVTLRKDGIHCIRVRNTPDVTATVSRLSVDYILSYRVTRCSIIFLS